MKRFALLCALAVCFAGVASAQDYSKIDVFAGYSYVHSDEFNTGINFNGGSASAAYNATPWLGLVGDFGGYHTNTDGISADVYSYLFGPRINFRRGKFTPFVQGLFGGAHATGSNEECGGVVRRETVSECGSGSDSGFAMTLGGGLDYNATEHIAIRVAQIEYLMTRFSGMTQNGVRVSTGVVIRF